MSILSDITNALIGAVDSIIHNVLGLVIIIIILVFIYLRYFKPKPIDTNEEVFRKQWNATTNIVKLGTRKKLVLCPTALSMEELRDNPHLQVNYQPIADVTGVNVLGKIFDRKSLNELAQKMDDNSYKKLLEENKEEIASDKFWIVIAIEKTEGGMPLFKKTTKNLVLLRPDQVINLNSYDNIIRVKGTGIDPIGSYLTVTDDLAQLTRIQVLYDSGARIHEEVTHGIMGKMTQITTGSIGLDSGYKKDIAKESVKIMNVPEKQTEVKQ